MNSSFHCLTVMGWHKCLILYNAARHNKIFKQIKHDYMTVMFFKISDKTITCLINFNYCTEAFSLNVTKWKDSKRVTDIVLEKHAATSPEDFNFQCERQLDTV